MVQSIAHSDPSERPALLRRFLGALGEALDAMRAGLSPLLAVYVWRGDLATHARLSPAG
jgi:hypothetical protein